ncbi:MAG: thioredoxin domain-containing protein, partial [Burkholderiales bacterium]|nr:thioredoxin domain-containing protein [Anaerolineae bacterium]
MSTSSQPRATAPRTRPEQRQKTSNQRPVLVVIAIITIAVIAAVVAIVLSNNPQGAVIDYTAIPQSRTDDGAFVLGNPDAPVTIVEFADFTCPHCQEYHETVSRFINEYVATGKAKFEYRMYPIVDPAFAEYAAQIAECGAEVKPNGGFWEAHDTLFQLGSSGRLSDTTTRQVADRMGVDYS